MSSRGLCPPAAAREAGACARAKGGSRRRRPGAHGAGPARCVPYGEPAAALLQRARRARRGPGPGLQQPSAAAGPARAPGGWGGGGEAAERRSGAWPRARQGCHAGARRGAEGETAWWEASTTRWCIMRAIRLPPPPLLLPPGWPPVAAATRRTSTSTAGSSATLRCRPRLQHGPVPSPEYARAAPAWTTPITGVPPGAGPQAWGRAR